MGPYLNFSTLLYIFLYIDIYKNIKAIRGSELFLEPTLMNMENQSVHNIIEKGQPEHPDIKLGSKLSENEKNHSISRSNGQSNIPSIPCLGELEWREISQILNRFRQKGRTFYYVLLKDGREIFVDPNVEHYCPDLMIKY